MSKKEKDPFEKAQGMFRQLLDTNPQLYVEFLTETFLPPPQLITALSIITDKDLVEHPFLIQILGSVGGLTQYPAVSNKISHILERNIIDAEDDGEGPQAS